MNTIEKIASLDELGFVIDTLKSVVKDDAIVFLRGDLAAGKTTLVQAYAKAEGIDESVTSPTFSLQHTYGERVFHYDLYRIDDDEFERLGLIEEFEKPGIHFVEWGSETLQRFLKAVGYNVVVVDISAEGIKRRYRITFDAYA